MALSSELVGELQELLGAARAHLEWEEQLGGPGLAVGSAPASVVAAAPVGMLQSVAEPAASAAAAFQPPASAATIPQPFAAPSAPTPTVTVPHVPGSAEERVHGLAALAQEAAACTACVLPEGRTKSVFARGNPQSEIVFVGEGPGRDEDLQGEPFVGRAGQLLDRMIVAMGYGRDDVYICNVVKCRPPENRTPRPEEALACQKFLLPQLELVAPKVIVALGRCAAQALGAAHPSGAWRGRWSEWHGVPTMSTYHPAFLLRSPEFKRTVWEDLQLVMARLGKPPAKRAT